MITRRTDKWDLPKWEAASELGGVTYVCHGETEQEAAKKLLDRLEKVAGIGPYNGMTDSEFAGLLANTRELSEEEQAALDMLETDNFLENLVSGKHKKDLIQRVLAYCESKVYSADEVLPAALEYLTEEQLTDLMEGLTSDWD